MFTLEEILVAYKIGKIDLSEAVMVIKKLGNEKKCKCTKRERFEGKCLHNQFIKDKSI